MGPRTGSTQVTQEQIVLALSVLLFVAFSVTLKGFFAPGNLLALVQNVSILGILGLGMAIAIIGRGIDLAIVTTMTMMTAWVLSLAGHGTPPLTAAAAGFCLSAVIGIVLGVLIAYVEIPAIFATLAMASVIYGFSRMVLVGEDLVYVPPSASWTRVAGNAVTLGVPNNVVFFLSFAALVAAFFRFTKPGRFLLSMGDNPFRARIVGIPVRPMIVLQYVASSLTGFAAGLIMAMLIGSMNTRQVNSTMVYDVILVVVLGGVGLSGGRGGVRNVLVGTLLIGILLNGMTIMDVPYILQNLIKGLILLVAIIVDSFVNPRDEQTSQQGDI
ncbi:ABC transporter permease [Bradyrhizobium sp. AS23.2]|uniref:ABC transporter permease n=1 Tax=Bradyrhizobium sp. AS23.2 TaxID=1680155 RepID=UPI00093D64E6|nr:ABC transporter permease [Bradyrhizobium sp. AS23.2]OKO84571.1 ABC transporter permease [Bradyrhizobium sp. AS23.2]